jgi:predicted MPP superfamily phosphohydrolase
MRKFFLFALVLMLALLAAAGLTACKKPKALTEQQKAAAEATEIEFIFASDTHHMSETGEIVDYRYPSFVAREQNSQKMNFISRAIFRTFCDEVIASGVKLLLIGGDLSETEAEVSHLEIAAELRRVEQHGVTVYVIPGNHDIDINQTPPHIYTAEGTTPITGVTRERFAEIYADFGYSGTKQYGGDALSYSVDLNEKYTLIACDDISVEYSEDHINWLAGEVKAAKDAGKAPLLMLHRPVGERFVGLYETLKIAPSTGYFGQADNNYFKTKMAEAGLTYILSAHVHTNDTMKVAANEEKTYNFVEVMGNALTTYYSGYYKIRFTKNYLDVSRINMGTPKAEYLPSYLSEADRSAILADFNAFAFDFTKTDFIAKIQPIMDAIPEYFAKFALGADLEELGEAEREAVEDFVQTALFDYVNAPIYIKDANGGVSVEGLAKKYGYDGTLPASCYTSLLDLGVTALMKAFGQGEVRYTVGSAEIQILKLGIYGIFANLAENDLWGFLSEFNPAIVDHDSTEMLNKLYDSGILDLICSGTLENIMKFDALQELPIVSAWFTGDVENLLYSLGNSFGMIKALLGIDLAAYFPADQTVSTENNIMLTGEIQLSKLFDEVVFGTFMKGIMFDDYVTSPDFVINRGTLEAYTKG